MTPDKPIGDRRNELNDSGPVENGNDSVLRPPPDFLPSERERCINIIVGQVVRGIDEPRFPPPEDPLTPGEIDEVIEKGPSALDKLRIKVLIADPAALGLIRKAVMNRLPEAWIDYIAEQIEPADKSIPKRGK